MVATLGASAAFELKGRMATLTLLRVLMQPVSMVLEQLDARLAQAPGFFDGIPLVISPAQGVALTASDLQTLVDGLKQRGLVPVGVADMPAALAAEAGLGVLRNLDQAGGSANREKPAKAPDRAPTQVVSQPVRSGQQIYARGGDLVVTAPVSAGAELMADGHIHVYASLRGRALAGVSGDAQARIFCHALHAELLAIAGHYQTNEQMPAVLVGQPAMIRLSADDLLIEAL